MASPARTSPKSVSMQLPGSGIVGTTAMAYGEINPEIRAGFTVVPAVVYLPIVPLEKFATNRSEPETAMFRGKLNPEINVGFTVAPAVVYAAIVSLFATNRSEPE